MMTGRKEKRVGRGARTRRVPGRKMLVRELGGGLSTLAGSAGLETSMMTGRVNQILRLLTEILDVRIAYHDPEDRKAGSFDIKEDSEYCRVRRLDPAFEGRCNACDQQHLREVREAGKAILYSCHDGLMEGMVPIYGDRGLYLGAMNFGQLRLRGGACRPPAEKRLRRLYEQLPEYSLHEMENIADLLRYFAEYIQEKGLIRHRDEPWVERLRLHIHDHISEALTVVDLARVINRSPSYLTHNFSRAFGWSPRQYIKRIRMSLAGALLREGSGIKEVARSLGFCDEFYFSRAFKQHHGVSPRDFV